MSMANEMPETELDDFGMIRMSYWLTRANKNKTRSYLLRIRLKTMVFHCVLPADIEPREGVRRTF
jgi:hypothetical protein